ncbi:tyrosine-type recombinase/integrase [bacterium]|nr:tyrosine-type recombinase/integrase [bacterium]
MASLHTYKDQSGTRYRISYYIDGHQKTRRLPKGTSRAQADLVLAKYNQSLATHNIGLGHFVDPLKDTTILTLHEFHEWFLKNKVTAINRGKQIDPETIGDYNYAFKKLYEAVSPNSKVSSLNRSLPDIEKILGKLNQTSHSIVVRHLRAAWNFGIEKNVLSENPFKKISITRDRRIPDILTIEEVEKIAQSIEDPIAFVGFSLIRYNGLRPIEVCQNIQYSDIELDSKRITIPESKRVAGRKVPIIFDELVDILKKNWSEGYVVPWKPNSLSRHIRIVMNNVGIKKKNALRILRHTFAHRILEGTGNLRLVQLLLGHTQIQTTTIYTQIPTSDLTNYLTDLKIKI